MAISSSPIYADSAQERISDTNLALTTTQDIPADTTIVIGGGHDNTSATAPTVTGIDTPGGESATWTINNGSNSVSTGAGAGIRGFLAIIKTTVQWNSGTTITVTYSAAILAKTMNLSTWTGAQGVFKSVTSNTVSSGSASTTSATIVVGELCIGAAFQETNAAPAVDSDTLNGSWAGADAGINTSGGSASAQIGSRLQYKLPSGTNAQVFNPTQTAEDGVILGVVEVATATAKSTVFRRNPHNGLYMR